MFLGVIVLKVGIEHVGLVVPTLDTEGVHDGEEDILHHGQLSEVNEDDLAIVDEAVGGFLGQPCLTGAWHPADADAVDVVIRLVQYPNNPEKRSKSGILTITIH